MITLREFSEKLKEEKQVAIIAHVRPDGDTIGSSLGLFFALNEIGVKAKLYCSDNVPAKYTFLKGAEEFSDGEIDKDTTALVSVDVAEIGRVGKYGYDFEKARRTFNIDHHISNTRFAKINYVKETASCAENIFDLIKELGAKVDVNIANALATGVITDTGNFRHKNVTEETLKKATELFSLGADFNNIIYNTFSLQTKERALLFGRTMANIKYYHDGRTAVGIVRLADFNDTGAKQEETEGFIDFIMGIKGVRVGLCVMETEKDKYKISFRAQTEDVNSVAATFGGGGHKLAAGCRIAGEIEEVLDRLIFAVGRVYPD